jgi:hypothetical protein
MKPAGPPTGHVLLRTHEVEQVESLGPPFGGGYMGLKLAGSLNGESTTYGQTLASF